MYVRLYMECVGIMGTGPIDEFTDEEKVTLKVVASVISLIIIGGSVLFYLWSYRII